MPYTDPERERQRGRDQYAADPEKYRARKRLAYEASRSSVTPIRRWGSGLTSREAQIVRHGLSLRGYAALLEVQGGCCALCGASESDGRSGTWHIDHDHRCCVSTYSCGRCIRGLLCMRCNTSSGALDWPTSRLIALVRYRNSPPWAVVVANDPTLTAPTLWGDDAS